MRWIFGLAALAFLAVAPVQAATKSQLKTAGDWYECAAYFSVSMLMFRAANNQRMAQQMALARATAIVKADELAMGSDAVPSPDALRRVFKEKKLERLAPYLKKHRAEIAKLDRKEFLEWSSRYNKRCTNATGEVYRQIKKKVRK